MRKASYIELDELEEKIWNAVHKQASKEDDYLEYLKDTSLINNLTSFKKYVNEELGRDLIGYILNELGIENVFGINAYKDISKVEFDFENCFCTKEDWNSDLIGFVKIGNLATWCCAAGGDWEQPVTFIIYWNGSNLRGYIPKDGNVWNHKHNIAFGNQNNDDIEFLESLDPTLVKVYSDGNKYPVQDLYERLINEEKIKDDIIKRISVINVP